jgi:hypothetical protein
LFISTQHKPTPTRNELEIVMNTQQGMKNAQISAAILAHVAKGMMIDQAYDAVFGKGEGGGVVGVSSSTNHEGERR